MRYAFVKAADTTEIDCYCDCFVLYSLSRKLHQQLYISFSESIGVFENIDLRANQYGLDVLQNRFSTII